MTTVSPLHVGLVDGHPIRFFRPPDARHELPWHAIDDLQAAMRLAPDERAYFLRCAKASPWAATDTATVATEAGPVPIGTHRLALGFIDALVTAGRIGERVPADYTKEGAEALGKLMGDLPPAAFLRSIGLAFRNTHDAPARVDDDTGGEPNGGGRAA